MRVIRRKNTTYVYVLICLGIMIYLVYFRDRSVNESISDPKDIEGRTYFADSGVRLVSTKIDWNDYVQIGKDALKTGRGEQGMPATLIPGTEHLKDEIWAYNGFNGLLSDQIALDRSLKDIRHKKCSSIRYNSLLPSTSIVIPFFEEHLSTLQRTVVSVINRSPAQLVKEIILVDDGSTINNDLRGPLEIWIQSTSPIIKLIRMKERVGLIAARLAGAKKATADVIVVLDSHCEVMYGWLPPLLEPIVEDPHTAVCPFIDVISADDFRYTPQDEGGRGAFDWRFFYKRLPLRQADIQNMPAPFENPVMNGGLFAISRKFFWELGGYDEGIKIWGGEQYNLSFKIWMCGGRLLDAPCSRVGHVFRKGASKRPGAKNAGDFISVNYKRLAVIWMDEYSDAIYKRLRKLRKTDPGDITKEVEIRKQRNCKSFKWYLETIVPDLLELYPPYEPPEFAHGSIKSLANPSLCIDSGSRQNGPVILYGCHGMDPQYFIFNYKHAILLESEQFCWQSKNSGSPQIQHCPRDPTKEYQWKYDKITKQIISQRHGTCVEADILRRELNMSPCNSYLESQKWEFAYVNNDIAS